ncbi:MAG: hypothetical protein HYV07_09565 [Deltaproteobacteria bacterium]|nr:hypothetical protein [Deltaproteobacteria bacterium]
MKLQAFLSLAAVPLALACTEDPNPVDIGADHTTLGPDTGPTDTGTIDTGAIDTGTGDAGVEEALAIEGRYVDGFGFHHVFTSTSWSNEGSNYRITQYSNTAMYFVAENAHDHPYNPDLWSRVDWVTAAGTLYYCQSAYDAATEAVALATARPSDTAPATTGCGGAFPWSSLTAE